MIYLDSSQLFSTVPWCYIQRLVHQDQLHGLKPHILAGFLADQPGELSWRSKPVSNFSWLQKPL